jgi:biopolymer transport protein ExbD
MAKRRPKGNDEILLIPFLDILCSLIGVLILIIVVLCVAQSQQTNGRSPEEIADAQKYQDLLKQQQEQQKLDVSLNEKLAKLEELRKQAEEKEQKLAKLRKLLDSSADIKKMNAEISQNLLKELDNLLVELNGYTSQQADLKKDIEKLYAELKTRQAPTQKVVPPVIVKPGGSGLAKGSKVFFIEASAGKLTYYWDQTQKSIVSAAPDVIATDEAFNGYLKAVHDIAQSKIIFLLRDDGMGAFNNGAGWAQATFGYRVDQIGKLPIPGRGQIDLGMFKEFLGSIPPLPSAKLVPPPGAPAAAPPAAPKPAAPATPPPPAKPPVSPGANTPPIKI